MTQRAPRVNYNLELLTKFCSDNHITLLKDYFGEKVNRDTRINGKCLTQYCENNFDKTFRQLYDFNGHCEKCTNNIRKEKMKVTCLEKYGVENIFQSQEIKEKMKVTCLEKYGVEHPLQSQKVKEKIKASCLEKYGVENPFQSQKVKEKIKAACLEKLGVEYSMQSQKVREKCKATCLKNHGVNHYSQTDEYKKNIKQLV
jgi:hypothetical protein